MVLRISTVTIERASKPKLKIKINQFSKSGRNDNEENNLFEKKKNPSTSKYQETDSSKLKKKKKIRSLFNLIPAFNKTI